MKKLIAAMVAVGLGFAAQAASFDWKTSATGKIYVAGSTTTLLPSSTAYIFDSAATTRQAVLTAFLGNSTWTTGSLNNKAVASGVITATAGEAFAWSNGDNLTAFIVLVDGANIYISDTQSQPAAVTGYSQFSFNAKATSQLAAMESTTFTTAGWYTASVPEPTSGLLLLLGMAGLALKRKRA